VRQGTAYAFLEHLDDADLEPSPIGRVEAGVARVLGVERPAILVQPPSRVRFPGVSLHSQARLSFGVGIHVDPGCSGPPLTAFDVSVEGEGLRAASLWSTTLAPEAGWRDAELDLAEYAGREVTVLLSARSPGGPLACRAAWSRPVIRSAGALVSASSIPIRRRVLVRDLLGATAPPIDLGSFVGYGELLQAPGPGPSGRATPRSGPPRGSLRFDLDVPAGAGIELAGEVLHGARSSAPPPASPVRFEARIDGEPALTREVQPLAAPVTFSREIPLGARAGRRTRLELNAGGGGEGTLAWWTSARLLRREDVARGTAHEGWNLLLVVVDTLRADHLGLYGARRDTSPNLDRLGRESLVFDRAISSCSWTQPSVATLLTGLSPIHHGMTGGEALDSGIETLAEVLQRAGMTTFGLSSNPVIGRREGFARGFETFEQVPWARAEQVDQLFLDWLQGHRDTRWFAYLHYIDPHDSYDAPPPLGTSFTSVLPQPWAEVPWELLHKMNFGQAVVSLTPDELEYLRGAYDGEIKSWDAGLGSLVEALGRDGSLEHTVLVVVGDHGEEFMDHGKLFHMFHLYDESVRVPLLVRAPRLVAPGRELNVFSLTRLKALLTELASGRSIASDRLRSEPAFSHTAMALGSQGFRALASVRDADWTYVLGVDDGEARLFDPRHDPGEKLDRAGQEPGVRSRYDALLRAWLASGLPPRPAWRDPDLTEKLRAMGYVR
jgi:arylsulfatase A-like enzyme